MPSKPKPRSKFTEEEEEVIRRVYHACIAREVVIMRNVLVGFRGGDSPADQKGL